MARQKGAWDGLELSDGRYRVEKLLGAGGMGFVYRAMHRDLGAEVVIKVPRPEMLQDADFAFRFKKEIQALVQLSHPHIVKINDVGEQEGLPFAVMQYLPGRSLEDRIEMGDDDHIVPHAAESLAGWLPDIARALDFVHAKNYIHRDIKPGNILFDESGFAFLSDFGIVKAITTAPKDARTATMTSAGGFVGTLEYMAYELVMNETYDGRADQYALAVTVYEVLAGRRPYLEQGPTLIGRIYNRSEPPPLRNLSIVPEGLARVIHKGMHHDQNERFPTCSAFASAVVAEVVAVPVARPASARTAGGLVALSCPHCLNSMAVTETSRGKKGRCKSCDGRIRIAEDLSCLEPIEDASTSTSGEQPAVEIPGLAITQSDRLRPPSTKNRRPAPVATEVVPNKPPAKPAVAKPDARRRRMMIGSGIGGVAVAAAGIAALVISLAPSMPDTPPEPERPALAVKPPPVPDPVNLKPAVPKSPPPLELAAIPTQTVTQGRSIQVQPQLKSPAAEAGGLNYSLVAGRPAGAEVDSRTGTFTWMPRLDLAPDDYSAEIEARAANDPSRVARVAFVLQVVESQATLAARAERERQAAASSKPAGPTLVQTPPVSQANNRPAMKKSAANNSPGMMKGAGKGGNRANPNPGGRSTLDQRIANVQDKDARMSLGFASKGMNSSGSYKAVMNHLENARKAAGDDQDVEECIKEIQKIADDVRAKAP